VFCLIFGLFVAARLWRLTAYSVRADEIFSIQAARRGWLDLVRYVIRDIVHPPLFYMLLKVWIGIGGESEGWLRLFPVLTAVATICPFVLLCREFKLKASEVNLAFMLIAVNGYLIYFAQELRMYSLLLLLTLSSLWLFAKFLNASTTIAAHVLALFGANLLLVYTHYYGWLVVVGESFLLLLWARNKLSAFLFSVAALIVCFSPWAYRVTSVTVAVVGLEGNIGSFSRPTLRDLGAYYATLNGPLARGWYGVLGQTLFVYPVLLWGWHSLKTPSENDGRSVITFCSLLLFSVLPVGVSFLISQVAPQSIWGNRFFINAAVPYLILVAMAIHRLHPKWLRSAILLFVIAWASAAGINALNNTDKRAWEPLVYQMIRAETSQAKGITVYAFGSSDEIIRFYLEKVNEKRFQTKRIFTFDKVEGDHFWVASRSTEELPQQILRDQGYRVEEGFSDGFGGLLSPVWRQ